MSWPEPNSLDLEATLTGFAASLDFFTPYEPPTPAEQEAFIAGLRSWDGQLGSLGYRVITGVDTETGRKFGLATQVPDSERSWGLYLLDLSVPATLAIEVPHPANDLHTEQLGLAMFRRLPGALLAVAGTHRRATDVANQVDSLFHAVATDAAARGLVQVQLHGFRDSSLPGTDVVVSPGAGEVSAPLRRAADSIEASGFAVARAWDNPRGVLQGKRNAQGIEAARRGSVFLHLEINRTVRDDPDLRSALVNALASAELTAG
jgi:hypothetical protein